MLVHLAQSISYTPVTAWPTPGLRVVRIDLHHAGVEHTGYVIVDVCDNWYAASDTRVAECTMEPMRVALGATAPGILYMADRGASNVAARAKAKKAQAKARAGGPGGLAVGERAGTSVSVVGNPGNFPAIGSVPSLCPALDISLTARHVRGLHTLSGAMLTIDALPDATRRTSALAKLPPRVSNPAVLAARRSGHAHVGALGGRSSLSSSSSSSGSSGSAHGTGPRAKFSVCDFSLGVSFGAKGDYTLGARAMTGIVREATGRIGGGGIVSQAVAAIDEHAKGSSGGGNHGSSTIVKSGSGKAKSVSAAAAAEAAAAAAAAATEVINVSTFPLLPPIAMTTEETVNDPVGTVSSEPGALTLQAEGSGRGAIEHALRAIGFAAVPSQQELDDPGVARGATGSFLFNYMVYSASRRAWMLAATVPVTVFDPVPLPIVTAVLRHAAHGDVGDRDDHRQHHTRQHQHGSSPGLPTADDGKPRGKELTRLEGPLEVDVTLSGEPYDLNGCVVSMAPLDGTTSADFVPCMDIMCIMLPGADGSDRGSGKQKQQQKQQQQQQQQQGPVRCDPATGAVTVDGEYIGTLTQDHPAAQFGVALLVEYDFEPASAGGKPGKKQSSKRMARGAGGPRTVADQWRCIEKFLGALTYVVWLFSLFALFFF
jgi:hypothetical protein